jgi:hypothetical protein
MNSSTRKSLSLTSKSPVHGGQRCIGQQQSRKPRTRLEGCIEYAQELCEDAGKLSMPQGTDKAEKL